MKKPPTHQPLFSVLSITILVAILILLDSTALVASGLPIIHVNHSVANEVPGGPEANLVLQARKDLAQRRSTSVDKVLLLEIRAVTWPDSSIGCPKAGKIYHQVAEKGFLIRLKVAKRMYFYHAAGSQNPFLCEQSSKNVPHPGKGDEFVPPPGIKID